MIKVAFMLFSLLFVSCGPITDEGADNPSKDDTPLEEACLTPNSSFKAVFDCNGKKIPDREANSEDVAWILPSFYEEEHQYMRGAGKFGGCSGTFIVAQTATTSSPVYILSNGHCATSQLLPEKGHYFNFTSPYSMKFWYYHDYPYSRTSYRTNLVRYATMDENDVALVELEDLTVGDLLAKGITPFEIASEMPEQGAEIENIGIPVSKLHKVVLRQSRCVLGEKVSLEEGDYRFPNSYKNKCSILGGSSGSGVFFENKVFGVMNTTVSDDALGKADCSIDKPCEVKEGKRTTDTLANYLQDVTFLSRCFAADGHFDRSQNTCPLKDL